MAEKPQSYSNHRKFVPVFLFGLLILVANAGVTGYRVILAPSVNTASTALVALALVLVAVSARNFALRVQDRVIRLEMRLKLAALLPADLQARIPDFTVDHLIALRFASDAELPELAARVLRDGLNDKTAIKKMVKNWQGDYLRA